MSYPDQVPTRRPAVVTLAAAVLALMALGALVYAVATLLALGGTVDRFRAAAADTVAGADDVDGVVALVRAGAIVSAVLTVLVGVLLVGLATGLLAGRRGARVATWVVGGLGLLAGCCTGALLLGQRATPLETGIDANLLGLLGEAYPSWWLPVNAGVSVAQMLGYLVVAVLLALPAANGWFARRPSRPAAPPPENPYRLHPPQGPLPPR
ncbi:hypothetical protein [Micromonospora halophytica]|uniref:Uncharacterized protein n=1 Tax=Micromonospora halophytica TaxID=47864 RepID=A0A1C5HLJ9_9ACTN|nr:hypothetical protein [Micromonospora halophytica]SCG46894.1 hypothetical protein GA0070560_10531 [Micromonospora halophytica]